LVVLVELDRVITFEVVTVELHLFQDQVFQLFHALAEAAVALGTEELIAVAAVVDQEVAEAVVQVMVQVRVVKVLMVQVVDQVLLEAAVAAVHLQDNLQLVVMEQTHLSQEAQSEEAAEAAVELVKAAVDQVQVVMAAVAVQLELVAAEVLIQAEAVEV
jgi:hypothetical protein